MNEHYEVARERLRRARNAYARAESELIQAERAMKDAGDAHFADQLRRAVNAKDARP